MLAVTDRKLCTVHLRVAALTIAGSLLLTAGLGGCAKFDAAFGKQEAVVQFKERDHQSHPAEGPDGLLAHPSGQAGSTADRSPGFRQSV